MDECLWDFCRGESETDIDKEIKQFSWKSMLIHFRIKYEDKTNTIEINREILSNFID